MTSPSDPLTRGLPTPETVRADFMAALQNGVDGGFINADRISDDEAIAGFVGELLGWPLCPNLDDLPPWEWRAALDAVVRWNDNAVPQEPPPWLEDR